MQETWELRAAFARRSSAMYGREVPAYRTLVEVAQEVNAEVLVSRGSAAQRLGGADRISAERHGAIRLGTRKELRQVAKLFAGLGMHPVGYYDLRDSGVPVVSTAFRPIHPDELERNPFRVFTSVLTTSDRRFFTRDLAARVEAFLAQRQLFAPELLALADRATNQGGLDVDDAGDFLGQITRAFELDPAPIEWAWHEELSAVSAVAADIAASGSTHINHLTPRVLDIDELHARMSRRGIAMIPDIQGPPVWDGPDLLLRQTSFRALDERRLFRTADGSITEGHLRVRFGEVEARGIALTTAGRDRYDAALARADAVSGASRTHALREVLRETFPTSEQELFLSGLGAFTAHLVVDRPRDGLAPREGLRELVEDGFIELRPVVYEDFLPRSAAGIFRSNLDGDEEGPGAGGDGYGPAWLADAVGGPVVLPEDLAADQTRATMADVAEALNVQVTQPPTPHLTGAQA